MKLHKALADAIYKHAEEEYPRESCGLIVRVGRKDSYFPCRNVAATKSEHFMLHHEDYAAAEDVGKVIALVHSHPDESAKPSEGDRTACETSELPWIIVEVRDGVANKNPFLLTPCGWKAPLIGRMFYHGVQDCMSIVRDFYKREFEIEIADPYREDEWWLHGQNLYMDNYAEAGFYRLKQGRDLQLQYGDVILMAIRSPVANHAGIYLGTTAIKECPMLPKVPNAMLHHLYGRASERVVYGGYWADCTIAILRHESRR